LRSIYKDNKTAANGIKKILNNKTDPILQENIVPTVLLLLIKNLPPKKSYLDNYLQKQKEQDEKRGKKKLLSKSMDMFKTSVIDPGLERKCSKKIFTQQRQEYSKNEETQKRKVFPKYLNKPTLIAMKQSGREFREPTVKTTIKVNVNSSLIRMHMDNLRKKLSSRMIRRKCYHSSIKTCTKPLALEITFHLLD
jgi:hypothetical protein